MSTAPYAPSVKGFDEKSRNQPPPGSLRVDFLLLLGVVALIGL